MTKETSTERHTEDLRKTTDWYLFSAFTILLIGAAASAWILVDTQRDIQSQQDRYITLTLEANSLSLEAVMHRTAAAVHRMAIMEEAIKEAPSKDVSVKRLALSIAMAKNGTGFEDRFLELARQGASEDELNSMRNSFLTSLFENYPPALKSQEGIQMQMDAVIIELRAAGEILNRSEATMKVGKDVKSSLEKAQNKAVTIWKILIGLASAGMLVLVFRNGW